MHFIYKTKGIEVLVNDFTYGVVKEVVKELDVQGVLSRG